MLLMVQENKHTPTSTNTPSLPVGDNWSGCYLVIPQKHFPLYVIKF